MTTNTSYNRAALIEAITAQALQIGEFTLASGKRANYYLDCRKLTLDSRSINIVADGMLEALVEGGWPDAVGGMAVGAVPITAAILARASHFGQPLNGFFVRKEAKEHGAGKQVEGPVAGGQKVVIVEDVVTTGGSSLQAVDACIKFGLEVQGVLAIIDRLEGGREAFAERGLQLQTLVTVDDLGVKPT